MLARLVVPLCRISWREKSARSIGHPVLEAVDRSGAQVWPESLFIGQVLRVHRQGSRSFLSLQELGGQNWRQCRYLVLHRVWITRSQVVCALHATNLKLCFLFRVLYQQQNQPMDALQAYICAVQLDKSHSAAWTNLGILYETSNQPRDALACYVNSARGSAAKNSANLQTSQPNLLQRTKFLQQQLESVPLPATVNK